MKQAAAVFERFPEVKLAYLFGSRAKNKAGPMSDYDFAVSLAGESKEKMGDLRLKVAAELCRALKTDAVDVVVFELAESPELKYNIIKESAPLFAREPYKVLIEPKILTEYFDFRAVLRRHHLTRA